MTFSHIAGQALLLAAVIGAPLVLAAGVVGLIVSLLQAATQAQDHSLGAVPKLIAVGVALSMAGAWMMHELATFAVRLYTAIPDVG